MFATNLTVVCRRRKVFVATLATVPVSVLLPGSILSAGSDNASLMAQTQVQNPARGYASNAKAASPMSRCMALAERGIELLPEREGHGAGVRWIQPRAQRRM